LDPPPREFLEKSEKCQGVAFWGTDWPAGSCYRKTVENGFSGFSHLRADFFGPQNMPTDAETETEIPFHCHLWQSSKAKLRGSSFIIFSFISIMA
jgi:hypothetical protein